MKYNVVFKPKKWAVKIVSIKRYGNAWGYERNSFGESWCVNVCITLANGKVIYATGCEMRKNDGETVVYAFGYSLRQEKKSRKEYPEFKNAFGWDWWRYGRTSWNVGDTFILGEDLFEDQIID